MNWLYPIAALISLACASYVWWHVWKQQKQPKTPEPCTHNFAIISAQPLIYMPTEAQVFRPAQTAVLKRCSHCGEHSSESYLGHWTLAEMLRTESETTELERMAR